MSEKRVYSLESEMSGTVQAKAWADALVTREAKHSGDIKGAMQRLEAKYGIPFQTFWDLRYRPPKDVLVGTYERLRQAHLKECQRQLRRMEHELKIAEATRSRADSMRADTIATLNSLPRYLGRPVKAGAKSG